MTEAEPGNQLEESTREEDLAVVDRMKSGSENLITELRKVIIGQDAVVEQIMIALFAGGHCLITGVPGLAKTLLIKTIADILQVQFSRIQFTPDLMPADVIGSEIIEENPATGNRSLRFVKGPIFAQILLADEINRTPPKTQSALLEAMEEQQVSVAGTTHIMEQPFFVLATQNPIELEGTYPLPEAQLDRFLFKIMMDYLSEEDEVSVVHETTQIVDYTVNNTVTGQDIIDFQRITRQVPVADAVVRYAVRLVGASRPQNPNAPEFVKKWISWGAGLRASQNLILAGKVRALLLGRYNVSYGDVRALALPVLRHRILLNFHAEAESVDIDSVVAMLLDSVPEPASGL
ncbi:MAG: MoxR family ATPase [Pseudomonadales bacterium]|jgi:MoxR-like ATPase|nr:MoxR family ATPase [Pseudomonadales bacterium]MDP7358165.1 MoxR family ATPase [Pseudomonadales bacterium]MDP7594519.1 MoxR family ATPase [Pseudomonadales bacterium]HJN50721.1 MoxR family ATPase [Pseudomonadales bacterium]|tara:strand:+ start:103 stop:1146 length:1044 start_codon:yes stop_codon:yes gene_type:complete